MPALQDDRRARALWRPRLPDDDPPGIYAAAPGGAFLGSLNSNDPRRVAAMMRAALDRWRALPEEGRYLKDAPARRAPWRWEDRYPRGGLVLRVNSRDLPRRRKFPGWLAKAWNQDYAWFTRAEARQFLPATPRPGAAHDLPRRLVLRLARLSLVDNVRGQTSPFSADDVREACLRATIVRLEKSLVHLRLEGRSLTSQRGRWQVHGLHRRPPSAQRRGFNARLAGRASFDLGSGRFTSFRMIALGMRWGGTQYNMRGDDLAPAPMGIAFTLAGDTPAERVAPAFIWAY